MSFGVTTSSEDKWQYGVMAYSPDFFSLLLVYLFFLIFCFNCLNFCAFCVCVVCDFFFLREKDLLQAPFLFHRIQQNHWFHWMYALFNSICDFRKKSNKIYLLIYSRGSVVEHKCTKSHNTRLFTPTEFYFFCIMKREVFSPVCNVNAMINDAILYALSPTLYE